LADVARIYSLSQLDNRVNQLAGDVERKLGVVLWGAGAFKLGMHFRLRPKCREELIDQLTLARLRLNHDRCPGLLSSEFEYSTESSTSREYLLNSKSETIRSRRLIKAPARTREHAMRRRGAPVSWEAGYEEVRTAPVTDVAPGCGVRNVGLIKV